MVFKRYIKFKEKFGNFAFTEERWSQVKGFLPCYGIQVRPGQTLYMKGFMDLLRAHGLTVLFDEWLGIIYIFPSVDEKGKPKEVEYHE